MSGLHSAFSYMYPAGSLWGRRDGTWLHLTHKDGLYSAGQTHREDQACGLWFQIACVHSWSLQSLPTVPKQKGEGMASMLS